MTTDLHEELIDDVREIWIDWRMNGRENKPQYWMMIDTDLMDPFLKRGRKTVRADAYIAIGDGYHYIALEVGNMPDGKWRGMLCEEDNLPIRVLRVTKDRHAYLLNPRHTPEEKSFMETLQDRLIRQDFMPKGE